MTPRAASVRATQLVSLILVLGVLVAGIWIAGGVVANDAGTARILIAAWILGFGALLALGVRHRRQLAVPVLGAWVVGSAVVGGYLLLTSSVDRVAHEQVVEAADGLLPTPTVESTATSPAPVRSTTTSGSPSSRPLLVSHGTFSSGEHKTTGTASLIELPGGKRVLTLTRFATSPGPDLRVYLVPGDGQSSSGHVDLGALKGNRGDQQYSVPAGSPEAAVLIWCRAFSARFGSATLS
jgi:hypothetical protein